MKMKIILCLFVAIFSFTGFSVQAGPAGGKASAPASEWVPYSIDLAHTNLGFRVKHLMVSEVPGKFKEATIAFDWNGAEKKVRNLKVSIPVASIDTGNADRDKHLRGADFFDVEKFPTLTFEPLAASFSVKHGQTIPLKGKLTLHGVTKELTLQLKWVGLTLKDPFYGKDHLGFHATGKLNRKDFGLTWNKALDQGGVVVGEEVILDLQGEAIH